MQNLKFESKNSKRVCGCEVCLKKVRKKEHVGLDKFCDGQMKNGGLERVLYYLMLCIAHNIVATYLIGFVTKP